MISIENVSVIRNGKPILKDINWNVKKGEHWSILGLNGSGKTTLLNIVNGYLFPSSGKVEVLGNVFGKSYIPDVRKEIGLISSSLQQQLREFDTVLSIVLSGKFASIGLYDAVDKEDVNQAYLYMKMLHCDHLQDEKYEVLSQGERQRVLIARALMANPQILILDEPCNGLDLIAREDLLQLISNIANEKNAPSIIYVTHHVEEVLPMFTNTLLMKHGEVFTQGLTEEIMNETTLSAFYDRPISIQKEQGRAWIAIRSETNVK